jgi:cell division septum initiation protein DivIVA
MVSGRSQALDQQMSMYQARDPHEFYNDSKLRESLNAVVDDLKKLLETNQNMEKTFREIQGDVEKAGDIQQFLNKLNDFDTMVD